MSSGVFSQTYYPLNNLWLLDTNSVFLCLWPMSDLQENWNIMAWTEFTRPCLDLKTLQVYRPLCKVVRQLCTTQRLTIKHKLWPVTDDVNLRRCLFWEHKFCKLLCELLTNKNNQRLTHPHTSQCFGGSFMPSDSWYNTGETGHSSQESTTKTQLGEGEFLDVVAVFVMMLWCWCSKMMYSDIYNLYWCLSYMFATVLDIK